MQFKPGDDIGGRFQVFKMLGEGGVGTVYRVHDKVRGHEVALKVLKPELTRQKLAVERFMREVKAVRRIEHPGVVPVYDTGKLGDMLFYTMECVRGHSIKSLIKHNGPFSVKRSIKIMKDICDIMEKVHEVAIHRDISSDNIMMQKDERIRVLDFGTARMQDEASTLTRTSMHLGKMFYSSPEQRTNSKAVDQRADIYSIGMLFFEMLTGEMVISYEPVTGYRSDLPTSFDTFFEKALAKDPNDRIPNIQDFGASLDSL